MPTLNAMLKSFRSELGLVPQVSNFPLSVMFGMCSLFLGLAALCQQALARLVASDARGDYPTVDGHDHLPSGASGASDKNLVADSSREV